MKEENILEAIHQELEQIPEVFLESVLHIVKAIVLILTWERWINYSSKAKSKADICFSMSGFEFVIECKRLSSASNTYLEEKDIQLFHLFFDLRVDS